MQDMWVSKRGEKRADQAVLVFRETRTVGPSEVLESRTRRHACSQELCVLSQVLVPLQVDALQEAHEKCGDSQARAAKGMVEEDCSAQHVVIYVGAALASGTSAVH
mmetsp:Transcript_58957/g.131935  ORF Transcript_58957/g.131935 Transcript_58957/m.131935 type:complete len:106 (-) Transcript_58957:8-325(-)